MSSKISSSDSFDVNLLTELDDFFFASLGFSTSSSFNSLWIFSIEISEEWIGLSEGCWLPLKMGTYVTS